MDANEIMTNDEVIETTEEIMKTVPSKGFLIAVGGLSVLAGGVAYKYIVKPIAAKIKSKKEQQMIVEVEDHSFEDDIESEED